MKRFFNILLGSLAMLAVALISAFITMRLAIHGREVEVPNLAGLTLTEASHKAGAVGLSLNLENRFYSADTPSGRILSQSPAPGAKVRREWTVRITESLGSQRVSIPNLVNQPERAATISIRRLGLEVGAVGYIPAAGPSGVVIAQTPTPDAEGVDRPRVSLLISQPEESAPAASYVMPSLTGLSLSAAYARLAPTGLHIVSAEDAPASDSTSPTAASGDQPSATATPPPPPPPQAISAVATVIGQTPAAGHRVVRGEAVRLTLSH